MRLISAEIHGYRRFVTPQRLYFDRPIICLVGANETGKSSALAALQLVSDEARVDDTDRSRGRGIPDDQRVVRLTFRLSEDDVDEIADLGAAGEGSRARLFTVDKFAGGWRHGAVDVELTRDLKPRELLADALQKAIAGKNWPDPEEAAGTAAEQERLDGLLPDLLDPQETLPNSIIDALRALAEYLSARESHPKLVGHLQAAIEEEEVEHPREEASSRLLRELPDFVEFDDPARLLEAEYELALASSDPPRALANLAALAELDVPGLYAAVQAGETGTAQTIRDKANEKLRSEFRAWTQEPAITVAFDHTDEVLRVHVQSGEGPLMRIDERSDGLKQFVALVALTASRRHQHKPILLIDEADRHLHYDAQGDLMQVLARQRGAEQIIYTTHSPACLPEDLGSSVRVLQGVGEQTESRVRNHFWTDEPGLGSMLMAMGAGSLAFVPIRPAVIVEGGTELVLLGTLVLEVTRGRALSYQIVPGSSNLRPSQIAGLDLQGTESVWLFDGDKNGHERRKQLLKSGIPESRIHLLIDDEGGGLDLEDLVRPAAYAAGVTEYARDCGSEVKFSVADLPSERCSRHRTAARWCEEHEIHPPSKPAIANKLLDLKQHRPLVDPQHRGVISAFHKAAKKTLGT